MFHVCLYCAMHGPRKFRQGGSWRFCCGFFSRCFSHQRISQRTVRTSLEKQLDPIGPISSRGGSVPVFLRTTIATCDFPGVCPDPLYPSGSTHVCWLFCFLQPCDHLLGKGLPLGSLVCDVSCVLSLSHMVSGVRCGTLLYRFLIFAFFFTVITRQDATSYD